MTWKARRTSAHKQIRLREVLGIKQVRFDVSLAHVLVHQTAVHWFQYVPCLTIQCAAQVPEGLGDPVYVCDPKVFLYMAEAALCESNISCYLRSTFSSSSGLPLLTIITPLILFHNIFP